ncbi:MAG TPA: hypothetical protein VJ324_00520 [Candidatus Acidoferrum sp.]|nr:hypothetical protein [Candidatus Acidoferrum sp.]
MSTSFVEYKGFGFWSRDNFLEAWLNTLLDETHSTSPLPFEPATVIRTVTIVYYYLLDNT